jgi:hypothetical protein
MQHRCALTLKMTRLLHRRATPHAPPESFFQSPLSFFQSPSPRILLSESFFQSDCCKSSESCVYTMCSKYQVLQLVQLLPFNLYSYACELHPFMSIVRTICAVDINICGPTVQGPAGIGSVGDVVGEGTHTTQPESSWPRMNARVLSMSG